MSAYQVLVVKGGRLGAGQVGVVFAWVVSW